METEERPTTGAAKGASKRTTTIIGLALPLGYHPACGRAHTAKHPLGVCNHGLFNSKGRL